MDDRCSPSFYSSCMHRHIEVVTTGRRQYCEGDIWDDYGEQVICLDCLSVLTEMDIRETWAGCGSSNHDPQQEF